ncbi:MFS family permease [Nocardiopsis mwathae]|uniref:MFS family permease n=1 Tax=Nocardiopsis mwathae TaxID=1472723 RepID=A0A7W9YFF2_9ACTN|nr:MFS family permease [Nocardiopsis mwathae]
MADPRPSGSDPPPAPGRRGPGRLFARFWAAHTSSNLADGIMLTALPLLAVAITTDPLAVAGLTAVWYLPWLLFGLHVGALVDRIDQRVAMVAANAVRGGCLAALTLLTLLGVRSVWLLYAAMFVAMTCEVVYDTAGRTLLPRIVPRPELRRANGRLEGGRIVTEDVLGGPVASLLFAVAAAIPLALNAGAYIVGAALVLALPLRPRRGGPPSHSGPPRPPPSRASSLTREALDGLRYIWSDRVQRGMALCAAAGSLAAGALNAILVLFVTQTLGVPIALYGAYMAVSAVGALIGAAVCDRLTRRYGAARVLVATHLGLASVLAALALAPGVRLGALAVGALGLAMTIINVVIISLLQTVTPEGVMGRAMASRRLLAKAAGPVGALAGGALGRIGLEIPFLFAAVALAAIPLAFHRTFRLAAARAAAAESAPAARGPDPPDAPSA